MKPIYLLMMFLMVACNNAAETDAHTVDRTDNDDTSAVPRTPGPADTTGFTDSSLQHKPTAQ